MDSAVRATTIQRSFSQYFCNYTKYRSSEKEKNQDIKC